MNDHGSAIFRSALPGRLKITALAIADAVDANGRFGRSVSYLAWSTDASRRRVQGHVSELRALGVLVPVCHDACATSPGRGHGQQQPVIYRFEPSALPSREPWEEARKGAEIDTKGAESAPFTPTKGAETDMKGADIAPFSEGSAQILRSSGATKGAEIDTKGANFDMKGANSAPDLDLDHERERDLDLPPSIPPTLRIVTVPPSEPEPERRETKRTTEQDRVLTYLHRVWVNQIGQSPDPSWCEDLVRRGLTETDADIGVQAAVQLRNRENTARPGRLQPYARAAMTRRIEAREAGDDPDRRDHDQRPLARRTGAAGSGNYPSTSRPGRVASGGAGPDSYLPPGATGGVYNPQGIDAHR